MHHSNVIVFLILIAKTEEVEHLLIKSAVDIAANPALFDSCRHSVQHCRAELKGGNSSTGAGEEDLRDGGRVEGKWNGVSFFSFFVAAVALIACVPCQMLSIPSIVLAWKKNFIRKFCFRRKSRTSFLLYTFFPLAFSSPCSIQSA